MLKICLSLAFLVVASVDCCAQQTITGTQNPFTGSWSFSDGSRIERNPFSGSVTITSPWPTSTVPTAKAIEDEREQRERQRAYDAARMQQQLQQQQLFNMQRQAQVQAVMEKTRIQSDVAKSNADRRRAERSEELRIRREKANTRNK